MLGKARGWIGSGSGMGSGGNVTTGVVEIEGKTVRASSGPDVSVSSFRFKMVF